MSEVAPPPHLLSLVIGKGSSFRLLPSSAPQTFVPHRTGCPLRGRYGKRYDRISCPISHDFPRFCGCWSDAPKNDRKS